MCAVASAQPKKEADTTKVRPSYKPTGIRFGTDLISLVRSYSDDSFNGWEVNGDIDFHRFYGVVDVGYWARRYDWATETGDLTTLNGIYSNEGTYFRIGADVNFLKKDPEKNMFFFGVRYGHSTFSENLVSSRTGTGAVFGPVAIDLSNNKIPANWFELTTGLRVRMWKFIWMGYTARLKFGLSTGEKGMLKPSDVPGYGNTEKEASWAFNYQIFFRLPLREATSVPLKK